MATKEPSAFGILLRQYRVEAALTQEELAERAGISARNVSDLERGLTQAPRHYTVRQLADALGLGEDERIRLRESARRHVVPSSTAPTTDVRELSPTRQTLLPAGNALGALPMGPLIAREEELGRIRMAVERVAQGEGRLVLLAGEPGVGKTRLAQEVTLDLHNRGFLVATGVCYESRRAVPYYPFLDALTTLYTAAPPPVQAQVFQRWPSLGRLFPELGSAVPTSGTDSHEEQERLFRAITGFVRAVADTVPVALLLDDLHWAEASSIDLLQHLARHTRASRVLLLGTYRDREIGQQHPLARALLDLGREQVIDRVAVQRLPQEGTTALLAATLGEGDILPELSAMVHRQTEGNPFFTQQVARALLEQGHISRHNGHWAYRDLEHTVVPEGVRAVIGQRISRLPPEVQELLQEASVLGQVFRFDDLHAMGSRSEDEVDAALEQATELGLVRLMEGDEYGFNHTLTQQALFVDLSPRRRRRLHRAAGEAIERLSEQEHRERAAELAWHFLEGGDPGRAFLYLLLAGDRAETLFARREAETHFRSAADLARERGDRLGEAQALERLGGVLEREIRYEEARTCYEDALSDLPPDDRLGRSRLQRKIALTYAKWRPADRPAEALRLLDHAQQALGIEPLEERRAWRQGWIELQLARAGVYYMLGRAPEMVDELEEALPIVEEWGTQRQRYSFLTSLSTATAQRDRYRPRDATVAYVQKAAALAESLGDSGVIAESQFGLGFVYLWHGDLDEAEACFHRALDLAVHTHDRWPHARSLTYLTMVYRQRGNAAMVRAFAQRSQEAAAAADLPGYAAMADAHLAWAALRQGLLAEARTRALSALEGWGSIPAVGAPFRWMVIGPLLGIELASGGMSEAIGYARALLAPTMQPLPDDVSTTLATAIAAWDRGEVKLGATFLQRAAESAREMGYL